MNRPLEVFGVSGIYWDEGWRTAGTLVVYLPRATTSTGAWIHAPPLLEESGLVDLAQLRIMECVGLCLSQPSYLYRGSRTLQ